MSSRSAQVRHSARTGVASDDEAGGQVPDTVGLPVVLVPPDRDRSRAPRLQPEVLRNAEWREALGREASETDPELVWVLAAPAPEARGDRGAPASLAEHAPDEAPGAGVDHQDALRNASPEPEREPERLAPPALAAHEPARWVRSPPRFPEAPELE